MNKLSIQILEHLEQDGYRTTKEIEEFLGLGRKIIYPILSELKSDGFVELDISAGGWIATGKEMIITTLGDIADKHIKETEEFYEVDDIATGNEEFNVDNNILTTANALKYSLSKLNEKKLLTEEQLNTLNKEVSEDLNEKVEADFNNSILDDFTDQLSKLSLSKPLTNKSEKLIMLRRLRSVFVRCDLNEKLHSVLDEIIGDYEL